MKNFRNYFGIIALVILMAMSFACSRPNQTVVYENSWEDPTPIVYQTDYDNEYVIYNVDYGDGYGSRPVRMRRGDYTSNRWRTFVRQSRPQGQSVYSPKYTPQQRVDSPRDNTFGKPRQQQVQQPNVQQQKQQNTFNQPRQQQQQKTNNTFNQPRSNNTQTKSSFNKPRK